jgi:NADH dehydrogenase (ubiquinone) 1 alpha subcomplex subunit 9
VIAKVAREYNVEKLIHFSALNASLTPPKIFFKPCEFLISKYLGEQAVRNEYPDAIIIRPSFIYGEGDKFLYYYIDSFRREMGRIPLWKKGEMTIKQPVAQGDVADGIMAILHNKDIRGVTYDFVGDEKFLLSDIIDYIFELKRIPIKRIGMTPTMLASIYIFERLFKMNRFNLSVLEREFISDALSTDNFNPTLADLKREQGTSFKKFEDRVKYHLGYYNSHSFYTEKLGQFKPATPPIAIDEDYEYQLRRRLSYVQ